MNSYLDLEFSHDVFNFLFEETPPPSFCCECCILEKKNSKATVICETCDKKLCECCDQKIHSIPLFKNHKHYTDGFSTYESKYCSKHPKLDLELYCSDCRQLICYQCYYESHSKHSTYTAEIACNKFFPSDPLQKSRKEVKEKITNLEDTISYLHQISQQIEETCRKKRNEINFLNSFTNEEIHNLSQNLIKKIEKSQSKKTRKVEEKLHQQVAFCFVLQRHYAHILQIEKLRSNQDYVAVLRRIINLKPTSELTKVKTLDLENYKKCLNINDLHQEVRDLKTNIRSLFGCKQFLSGAPKISQCLIDQLYHLNLPDKDNKIKLKRPSLNEKYIEYTIVSWIKIASTSPKWRNIFHNCGKDHLQRSPAIYICPNSTDLFFRHSTSLNKNDGFGISRNYLQLGQWVHYATSFSKNSISHYINGKLVGSRTLNGKPFRPAKSCYIVSPWSENSKGISICKMLWFPLQLSNLQILYLSTLDHY
ncbi:hypothetical protein M0812_28593 [Anaeramoeba flamelloides]|uniref:B box-type domain-containing protein n=1 Tax=Anaeramoeba flamelloides TaxID=1746091 RepID=A0AAV7YF76_9EUKA|nr:hypothetical protein M0812_28593 [Anaeramoeba flamelloides]